MNRMVFVSIQDYTRKDIIWLYAEIRSISIWHTCKIGGGPTEGKIGNSGNELAVDSVRSGVWKYQVHIYHF